MPCYLALGFTSVLEFKLRPPFLWVKCFMYWAIFIGLIISSSSVGGQNVTIGRVLDLEVAWKYSFPIWTVLYFSPSLHKIVIIINILWESETTFITLEMREGDVCWAKHALFSPSLASALSKILCINSYMFILNKFKSFSLYHLVNDSVSFCSIHPWEVSVHQDHTHETMLFLGFC